MDKSALLLSFELAAPFETCFEWNAFDNSNSNLANDNSIGDYFEMELSFARFESVLSKAFHSKQVWKGVASLKLSSDADCSKLFNAFPNLL